MNVNKFNRPVTNTKLSFDGYQKKLKRQGYKLLDAGYYADVFMRKGGRTVIKMGEINNSEDRGNFAYLEYVFKVENSSNPFFPKIKRVQLFRHKTGAAYYVVEMERLNDINSSPTGESMYRFMRELFNWGYTPLTGLTSLVGPTTIEHLIEVQTTLQTLKKRYDTDIHSNNIMIRGRGSKTQIVLTDPVA